MLILLTNPLFIPKILELARIVPDVPLDVLEKMLLSGINDKDSVIYVDEKDGKLNGFIFASKETWAGKPICFIQFCVILSSEEKYVGFELLVKVRLWAKDRGLKNIITVVKRDPKAFMRKYGFIEEGTVLKRSAL